MAMITTIDQPETVPKCSVPNCPKFATSQVVMLNIAFEYAILPSCNSHTNRIINANTDGVVELQRYNNEER